MCMRSCKVRVDMNLGPFSLILSSYFSLEWIENINFKWTSVSASKQNENTLNLNSLLSLLFYGAIISIHDLWGSYLSVLVLVSVWGIFLGGFSLDLRLEAKILAMHMSNLNSTLLYLVLLNTTPKLTLKYHNFWTNGHIFELQKSKWIKILELIKMLWLYYNLVQLYSIQHNSTWL